MKISTKFLQLQRSLWNIKVNTVSLISKRKLKIPIYLFCHHKTGTILLTKVFSEICQTQGWKFLALPGMITVIPDSYDVILFMHSLVDQDLLKDPFWGIHVIRDPRDVIVSGYQYHLRTTEKWCTNKDFSLKSPIKYPQVPPNLEHFSEEWKVNYVKSLNNLSYQETLQSISKRDGLVFEMNNFASWTIESMMNWNYEDPRVLEITFENLMNYFDDIFMEIFKFSNFSECQIMSSSSVAKKHDLQGKSDNEVASIKHVTSKETSRWMSNFEKVHKDLFIEKFGNILIRLGYEKDNLWQ